MVGRHPSLTITLYKTIRHIKIGVLISWSMSLHTLFHCPNCNAGLELENNRKAIVRCDYCHSMVIVPVSLRQKSDPSVEENIEVKRPPKPIKPQLSEPEAIAKVTELARNGEPLEAMKLYRETFSVGLKETKAAIDQVEMGLPLPIPVRRWEDEENLPEAAAEEITRLVGVGQMAEAAKLYRITFDTSQVEANTAVEQLREGKSINIAREKAKNVAQATAVRREDPDIANDNSSRPFITAAVIIALLILLVLVALVLLVLVF
jgi:ribosomal protein L7/L12